MLFDFDLGVLGAPCNPYSTQRTKRKMSGSVEGHDLYDVLMVHGLDFMVTGNAKAYIVEQVEGFGQPFSKTDATTPLERQALKKGMRVQSAWRS